MILVVILEKSDPTFQLFLDIIRNHPSCFKLHGEKKDNATFLGYNEAVASFASNVEVFLFGNAVNI